MIFSWCHFDSHLLCDANYSNVYTLVATTSFSLATNPKIANDAEYKEKYNEVNLLLHKTFVSKSYVNGSVT